jgi:hypothetical protein
MENLRLYRTPENIGHIVIIIVPLQNRDHDRNAVNETDAR